MNIVNNLKLKYFLFLKNYDKKNLEKKEKII